MEFVFDFLKQNIFLKFFFEMLSFYHSEFGWIFYSIGAVLIGGFIFKFNKNIFWWAWARRPKQKKMTYADFTGATKHGSEVALSKEGESVIKKLQAGESLQTDVATTLWLLRNWDQVQTVVDEKGVIRHDVFKTAKDTVVTHGANTILKNLTSESQKLLEKNSESTLNGFRIIEETGDSKTYEDDKGNQFLYKITDRTMVLVSVKNPKKEAEEKAKKEKARASAKASESYKEQSNEEEKKRIAALEGKLMEVMKQINKNTNTPNNPPSFDENQKTTPNQGVDMGEAKIIENRGNSVNVEQNGTQEIKKTKKAPKKSAVQIQTQNEELEENLPPAPPPVQISAKEAAKQFMQSQKNTNTSNNPPSFDENQKTTPNQGVDMGEAKIIENRGNSVNISIEPILHFSDIESFVENINLTNIDAILSTITTIAEFITDKNISAGFHSRREYF